MSVLMLSPFQTMKINGKTCCLTHLGVGLNIAPLITKPIISTVLSKEEAVGHATLIKEHLVQFELECKGQELFDDGARVLRLAVMIECDGQCYCVGGLSGTFQCVVGFVWLMKYSRGESLIMKGWDGETDTLLQHMFETMDSMQQDDLTCRDWCVDGWGLNVLVFLKKNFIATGVSLKIHGTVLGDASWLQSENNVQHINSQTGCHVERYQFGSPVESRCYM